MELGDLRKVPVDFPREDSLSALPGLQPKVGARLIDGEFVVGLTHEELFARYDACEDLVVQLVNYCDRKLQARPEWDLSTLLEKVRTGIGQKGWDLSPAKFTWIMSQVSMRMPGRSQGK